MAYFMVRDSDLTAERGPHPAASPFDKRVSENLKLHAFEMYKVELPAGASTEPHDHLEDGVQDAYAIVTGSGWLVVDEEEIAISAGAPVLCIIQMLQIIDMATHQRGSA